LENEEKIEKEIEIEKDIVWDALILKGLTKDELKQIIESPKDYRYGGMASREYFNQASEQEEYYYLVENGDGEHKNKAAEALLKSDKTKPISTDWLITIALNSLYWGEEAIRRIKDRISDKDKLTSEQIFRLINADFLDKDIFPVKELLRRKETSDEDFIWLIKNIPNSKKEAIYRLTSEFKNPSYLYRMVILYGRKDWLPEAWERLEGIGTEEDYLYIAHHGSEPYKGKAEEMLTRIKERREQKNIVSQKSKEELFSFVVSS